MISWVYDDCALDGIVVESKSCLNDLAMVLLKMLMYPRLSCLSCRLQAFIYIEERWCYV